MGMFDRIMLPAKCPNCGDGGIKEFQTKELECELNEYRKGDFIGTTQFRWLHCYVGCTSDKCLEWEREKYNGRSVGFGYGWVAAVEVDDAGRVVGVMDATAHESGTDSR